MATSEYHIKEPTTRKIKRRGWTPIRYRLRDCAVHGWLIEKSDTVWLIWLIGDETTRLHPRALYKKEWKHVVEL